MAFVPPSSAAAPSRSSSLSMSKVTVTPELEAAIADVRSAAAAFSDETAHFANGRCSMSYVCAYVVFMQIISQASYCLHKH